MACIARDQERFARVWKQVGRSLAVSAETQTCLV
jgi:hypothetical protein